MSERERRQPAEWEPHAAVWSAWPSHAELWLDNLAPARREVAAFFAAVADVDPITKRPRGELLRILAAGREAVASASAALTGTGAEIIDAVFGDIWLRDTAPIFVRQRADLTAACFRFNGWGGKYVLAGDEVVAQQVAAATGLAASHHDWVLEGGSIDVDGSGTALTTRECLLHPNRNPSLGQDDIERRLCEALGIEKLIWLADGLANDHTDGHVDNIARFVAPGVVVCMEPSGSDDPNRDTLRRVLADLRAASDADGRRLEVCTIPSPGRVEDEEGHVIPASHVNFYIGNTTVVVPTYGTATEEAAVKALAALFPGRRTIGLSAHHLISGGGSFHCITQQQPAASRETGEGRERCGG
jgi:agmatine deiminase